MPRPVWNGTISFGLVSVPVKLYSAASERPVRFNQLDRRDGARIRQKRVNEVTGEEVDFSEVVKGYEIAKGTYVTVTDDELAAIAAEATHRLDLECFVDLDEIDPIFYDGAYVVAPAGAPKPYALLVRAMEEARKVAIARFVMRSKEHVAVLRPRDGALVLSMMVYADEMAALDSFEELHQLDEVEVSDKELAMAESLIDALAEPFEPERYHDSYRAKVLDLIEQKSHGAVTDSPVAPAAASGAVVDLMAALQASVEESKAARRRHPTARPGPAVDAGTTGTAAKKAPARKATSTAKKAPSKRRTA